MASVSPARLFPFVNKGASLILMIPPPAGIEHLRLIQNSSEVGLILKQRKAFSVSLNRRA